MATTKAKTPAVPDTTKTLQNLMDAATNALRSAKSNAVQATAYCYMVWRNTRDGEGQAWYAAAVADANKKIDAHNLAISKQRSDCNAYKNGKLAKNHLVNTVTDDASINADIAAEKQRLQAGANRTADEWTALRQQRIEAKPGANAFTEVAKFVFGFVNKTEASHCSRYAGVCSYVHTHFGSDSSVDVDAIVDYLTEAGGFEAAYAAQVRTKQKNLNATGKADEVKVMKEKAKAINAAAVKDLAPMATFTMHAAHVKDGYVVLLARADGDKVSVIGEAPVNEAQITKLVSQFEAPQAARVYPTTAFVHRVLSLGELAGGAILTSETAKLERKLSMRTDANGDAQLLVSVKGASAGIVIHAAPNQLVQLGSVAGMVALPQSDLKLLSDRMSDALYRRFTEVAATAAPTVKSGQPAKSKLGWELVNDAMETEKVEAKREKLYWANISGSSDAQIDIDEPKFTTCLHVPHSAVRAMYDNGLSVVKSSKDPTKGAKIAKLRYDAGKLVLDLPAKDDLAEAVTADKDEAVELSFRLRDLIALVEKLMEQVVDTFNFEFDADGLLAVKWSDELGHYAVYLPTVTESGLLNNKRIAKAKTAATGVWMLQPAKNAANVQNRDAIGQIVTNTPKRAAAKKKAVAA